jgi:hypothetical protein
VQALARFIGRGPLQGGLVATTAALVAMMLPPIGIISGATPALVTLRRGGLAGVQVVVVALVGTGLLGYLLLNSPWVGLGIAAIQWLPVVLLALILRQTVSLPLAVLAAGALGMVGLAALYLVEPDPGAMWRAMLEQLFRPKLEQAGTDLSQTQIDALLDQVARMMSAALAASLSVSMVLSLLLARWWQALLDNPGGFGREFRSLRLGRSVSFIALVVFVAVALVQGPLLLGLAAVLAGILLFQGLAVVHGLVAVRRLNVGWLVAVYVLLFLVPQSLVLLSALGLVDNWLDLRARVPGAGQ